MPLLDKIKFLRPKRKEVIYSTIDSEIIDAFQINLSKFSIIIQIFIKKGIALDKFLKDYNPKNYKTLIDILNKLKTHMFSIGGLDEFRKSLKALEKLLEEKSFPESIKVELAYLITQLDASLEIYNNQFE